MATTLDTLEDLRDIIADQHARLCRTQPGKHRAIAFCDCETAEDYRRIKDDVKKQRQA